MLEDTVFAALLGLAGLWVVRGVVRDLRKAKIDIGFKRSAPKRKAASQDESAAAEDGDLLTVMDSVRGGLVTPAYRNYLRQSGALGQGPHYWP